MTRKYRFAVAAAALAAVIGTACSSGDGASGEAASTQTTVTSGAATLRASLTALLQEHVYLAGLATGTALAEGLDAPPTSAAVATLDQNSVDLAAAIGSIYGEPAGDQFLELWRKHIGFFVDYTAARATGNAAGAAKARTDLDGYRADFGAFLSSANPNLTKEAVAESLVPHVGTLFDAIDAQVAGDPQAIVKLREAAAVMPAEAELLAGAIVTQFPSRF